MPGFFKKNYDYVLLVIILVIATVMGLILVALVGLVVIVRRRCRHKRGKRFVAYDRDRQ